MTDTDKFKFGGAAMVVIGIGFILFGGTKSYGTFFEFFGFSFGTERREPMSLLESWFWGVALIAGGGFLYQHGG